MRALAAWVEPRLRRAWQSRGALARALLPLAWVYGALARRRARAVPQRLPVPVVVVGNVVAGGAGKTPVTLAVVAHLRARGWRPGIVSRGYGREVGRDMGRDVEPGGQGRDCLEVHPGDDPRRTGDEPLLLRRRAGVPVFVARRRAQAGAALLAAHPQVDVLVCDDGLQHRALARDVEICVFDARGVGNGWLLPAGPLRERWPRPVDLVLHTEAPAQPLPPAPRASPVCPARPDHGGGAADGASASSASASSVFASPASVAPAFVAPAFVARRSLAGHALRSGGDALPLAQVGVQPVLAVAAIARPEAFFGMLRAAGVPLAQTLPLPDHADLSHPAWLAKMRAWQGVVVCTEKDAVKLWPHLPGALAVPLRLDVPDAFWHALDALLPPAPASAPAPAPADARTTEHHATTHHTP